jgi:hypothetical protein
MSVSFGVIVSLSFSIGLKYCAGVQDGDPTQFWFTKKKARLIPAALTGPAH